MNIATNVGQEFLKLIDFHFPPGDKLHSVLNRSTVKVSYRCLPNMGAQVAKHNAKILNSSKNAPTRAPPSCNCQKSKVDECPLPGACNQDGAVYQTTVGNTRGNEETYVGQAKNFKKRWYKHKTDLEKKPEKPTTLSTYFWKEMEAGREPTVRWKILEKNIPDFNPLTGKCQLCIREKYNIVMNTHLCTLNSRQEMFAHCRHKKPKLIDLPPD